MDLLEPSRFDFLTVAIFLLVGAVILILLVLLFKKISGKKNSSGSSNSNDHISQFKANELRQRTIDHIHSLSRIIALNPVIPGNTPDSTTLESRNRTKCLSLIIEALPPDPKSRGVRMAEYVHQLSDHLVTSYGKENIVHLLIDAEPIILDVDSAVDAALILNELISNAIQYAPLPGEKSKVNIIFKERTNKLFTSVGDNGIGMKSPYIPKFSFGLQLVNTLVQKHKGEMIITSRPGTRVEITLSEFQKAEREVFITPTKRVY